MKVILIKDVKGQGKAGDVITVSDGYGANYLLKNKLAEEATPAKLSVLNQKKASEQHKKELEKAHYQEMAARINKAAITMAVKTGANGKIFGSIQSANIADELTKAGFEIDKKKINLPEPIKTTGKYTIEVRPYPEISAKFTLTVVEQK